MPTYTIVAAGTNPLGPNEIAAGGVITVSDGDVFIISPSADANLTFQAAGGVPADFDITFSGSNANDFDIKVEQNLTPSIDIPDNTDLTNIDLNAVDAEGLQMTGGNNVSFGKLDGADDGSNVIVLGDNFTTDKNWTLGEKDDTLIVGDDATFKDINTGDGNDTVTFGDRATVHDINTDDGNDSVTAGDDFTASKVSTQDDNDTIRTGQNAQVNEFDGGEGTDSHATQTTGTNDQNMETTTIVCYALGTLIDTPRGTIPVEDLRQDDLVKTLDHASQPIQWIRHSEHLLKNAAKTDRPVLIKAGALGKNLPIQDLIVSPQHRILVGGNEQLTQYFPHEAFAPAKALTGLSGIRHMQGRAKITWIHFACRHHEVITANGCMSESLLLGPMVLNGVSQSERRQLLKRFAKPMSPHKALNGPAARPCLTVGEVRRQIDSYPRLKAARLAQDIHNWDLDLAMEHAEAKAMRRTGSAPQNQCNTAA